MEIKILQVFLGADGLPYKDQERTVHFPIVGSGFQGAGNTTKIRFYYDELVEQDDTETSWVACAKLPNGKIGSKVLETEYDSTLGEHYALLELDSFYFQYKGDVYISLQGYQGGVQVSYDEETELYTIYGTPTIAATGSIKLSVNYATQFVGSGETSNVNFQRILADLGTKLGIRAQSEHVEELPSVGQNDIFYVVNDDPNDPNLQNIYVWNEKTQSYVWVGDNTLDLGDYYTQEQGEQFENEIDYRVDAIENQVQQVASGSPKGVYATLEALQAAYPTGAEGIYVVEADGKWYYWSGSVWTAGGTYLPTGFEAWANVCDYTSKTELGFNYAIPENNIPAFIGGNAFNGFAYPIKNLKNICGVRLFIRLNIAQIETVRDYPIILEITDSSFNTILKQEIKGVSFIPDGRFVDVIFGYPVDIDTDYGFIKIYTTQTEIEMGYGDARTYTPNTNVLRTDLQGKYTTNGGTSWVNLTLSQTAQFVCMFNIITSNSYNMISVSNYVTDATRNNKKENNITVSNASGLVSAINSIATSQENNKASKNNIYNIYLQPGNYELYGVVDLSNVVGGGQIAFKRGLEIPDFVNLIGVGNVKISMTLPNTETATNVKSVSTININNTNNIFKNITFECTNARYCVHDDGQKTRYYREVIFENCNFNHKGNSIATAEWAANNQNCYGGGVRCGRKVIFKNCTFKAQNGSGILFHTGSALYMTDIAELEINNCYFENVVGNSNKDILIDDPYGISITANISLNNSNLEKGMTITGTYPFKIFGGGNSSFTITNNTTTPSYIYGVFQ